MAAISYICIVVAIIILAGYTFINVFNLRDKIETLEEKLNVKHTTLEQSVFLRCEFMENALFNNMSFRKPDATSIDINSLAVQLRYDTNKVNALFKYNNKCIFEAIIEDLNNIYYIYTYKDFLDEMEDYKDMITERLWFIANGILHYAQDKRVETLDENGVEKLNCLRDKIIGICKYLIKDVESIDEQKKLSAISAVLNQIVENINNQLPVSEDGENWELIREMAS